MNDIKDFFNKMAPSWDQDEGASYEIKKELLDNIKINNHDKVLDVACGTGAITYILKEYTTKTVMAIDLSDEMIKVAKNKYKDQEGYEFICGDFMEFDDKAKFDDIVIYNAYPHFKEPERLANKVASLLNNNGKVAIIHSLSRKELDAHHANVMHISRSLTSPQDEYNSYWSKSFNLEMASESDHNYILICTKKA